MRYAPGHKEATRRKILEAAGRTFRLRGYDGIGVDGLAKDAGITSGAFYGHFRNKEAAFQEAVTVGLEELRLGVEKFRAEQGEHWLKVFVQWYLSRERREELALGCALPSLTLEVTRASNEVKTAYQTELLGIIEAITAGLSGETEREKREQAITLLALLSGGVTLARAVADEAVAAQIAEAICQAIESPTVIRASKNAVQPASNGGTSIAPVQPIEL